MQRKHSMQRNGISPRRYFHPSLDIITELDSAAPVVAAKNLADIVGSCAHHWLKP